jgi:hypothetical protein
LPQPPEYWDYRCVPAGGQAKKKGFKKLKSNVTLNSRGETGRKEKEGVKEDWYGRALKWLRICYCM